MNKNLTVIVMCGVPGSGKSTYASKYIKDNDNTYIVSRDAIRYMVYGQYEFNPKDESFINEIWENSIKILLKRKKDIIIDDTNVSSKDRKKLIEKIYNWASLFEIDDVIIKAVWILPRKEYHLEKRMENCRGVDRSVWESVINKMSTKFTMPTFMEGFNEVEEINE